MAPFIMASFPLRLLSYASLRSLSYATQRLPLEKRKTIGKERRDVTQPAAAKKCAHTDGRTDGQTFALIVEILIFKVLYLYLEA